LSAGNVSCNQRISYRSHEAERTFAANVERAALTTLNQ